MAAQGAPIEWFKEYTAKGEQLTAWPVGQMSREIGVPSVCLDRDALLGVLVGALDDGAIRAGMECVGFCQDTTGVTARFADGGEERGDLLIGADGIRSVVRRRLRGTSDPRYAGYTAWRAIIPFTDPQAPEDTFAETWGRGKRFIHYPVGGGRHYLSCFMAVPEDMPEPSEGRRAMLLKRYARWLAPTRALIEATPDEEIHRTAIVAHLPLRRWGEGRVTLLGDAAHPMTPNLGQGACQAIEDAVVLAKCLREGSGDLTAALRAYEARRKGRTASIMMRSLGIGLTGRIKHPLAVTVRDRLSKVMFNTVALKGQRQDMAYRV
jgi:2-polyprenyl-6-methoxyphenol hydroxylase-like FAD-dependent oxidoreductase